MDERKQENLTIAEKSKKNERFLKQSARYSNPIMKKVLDFHHMDMGKFKVKDMFKP